jgi:hypothetical protein
MEKETKKANLYKEYYCTENNLKQHLLDKGVAGSCCYKKCIN